MNLLFESNILAFTFLTYISLCCTFLNKKYQITQVVQKSPLTHSDVWLITFFLCVGIVIVDGVKIFHQVTIPISLVFGIFISVSATKVKYKFDSRKIQKFQNIVQVSKWPTILGQCTHLQWMLAMVPIIGYPKMGLRLYKIRLYLMIDQSLNVPLAYSTLKNHIIFQKLNKNIDQIAFSQLFSSILPKAWNPGLSWSVTSFF